MVLGIGDGPAPPDFLDSGGASRRARPRLHRPSPSGHRQPGGILPLPTFQRAAVKAQICCSGLNPAVSSERSRRRTFLAPLGQVAR